METTISDMIKKEVIPASVEPTNNDSLKQLNSYLNSDYEDDYEDYVGPDAVSIPSPVMREDGLWQIPGTTKGFENPTLAYNAARRFKEFQRRNEASLLIYGVTFDEYAEGVNKKIDVDDNDKQPTLDTTQYQYSEE